MTGIYKITSPSGKIYIGQSVNIDNRFYRYSIVSVNIKGQTRLYRSFLKYGVINHEFESIEECEESLLNERERYWQDFYDVTGPNGLNCRLTKTKDKSGRVSEETIFRMSEAQKGNNNWLGKTHSEESKEKIRQAKIGTKFSYEVNKSKGRKGRISSRKGIFSKDHPRSIKVGQYDMNMKLIREWDSLMDIKRELSYSIGNISSCINGKLNNYKKCKWVKI